MLIPGKGEGWIFVLNGISFITIIIGLMFVRTKYKVEPTPRTRPLLHELLEGGKYLFTNKSVGWLILIAGVLGLFAYPIIQQLPVLSKDVLAQAGDTKSAVDARNSALYIAQGVGALIAAFSIAMNNSDGTRGRRLILGELAFMLGMISIAFLTSLPPAILTIAIMGWGSVTQLATMTTLIQLQVPDQLRGRVFSIYLWALQGVAPLGSLLVGWMTQKWNLPATALACGVVCLLGVGGIQIVHPGIRRSEA